MGRILRDKLDKVFSKMITTSIEQHDIQLSAVAELYIVEVVSDLSSATHVMAAKPVFINDLLRKGLDSDGLMRREYLRLAGDVALFVSGFFPDSLRSKRIFFSLGDFIEIGQMAYSSIDTAVFDELSNKFPEVVDVLNEVSVEAKLTSESLDRYIERRRAIDARITRR